MTQIGPRFTSSESLKQLKYNKTDNKVNLSKPEGIASQDVIDDLQGALDTNETNILLAKDVHEGTKNVDFVVLNRSEAQALLTDLKTQSETVNSFTIADITLPESVNKRHDSELSNQTAQLVQGLSSDKNTFNLKLSPKELSSNAIKLDQHYATKETAIDSQIQKVDTHLAALANRIGELTSSGENPAELETLSEERTLLSGMKDMLSTQKEILGQMSQVKYSWNNKPTDPGVLKKLETLSIKLDAQVSQMNKAIETSPLGESSPYLSAQMSALNEQAQTMGDHLQDCVDYCQDPEMSSARTVLGKELNINAVMRDYENTLDLIAQKRRKAPDHMLQETHDLQGFKNATLNSVSYSQSYQKVFSEWNQDIGDIDFGTILEADDADAQIETLRSDLAAKIDTQFMGPEGYTIKESKVNQVKQLFDDHLMGAKADALAQKAGSVPNATAEDIKQNLSIHEVPTYENQPVIHQPILADNTRVETQTQIVPDLKEVPEFNLSELKIETPKNPLKSKVTQAAIDNKAAKDILPTLTNVVPTGFGDPAKNSLDGVHDETEGIIKDTQTQISKNQTELKNHYKAGNMDLNQLPDDVRTDMEKDFVQAVLKDDDVELSVAMTHKDWPPLTGVRQNTFDFAQAYDAKVGELFENAEVGSDEHQFMRCMQAMELSKDPDYTDDIDMDKLKANIVELKGKLADDFKRCEEAAMKETFGNKDAQMAKVASIKKELLSENFLQRLSVLPNTPMEGGYMSSSAELELQEAMSLIKMLNPDEDLSALSGKVMTGMVANNPGSVLNKLPDEEQHKVLDQTQALFETLNHGDQMKILNELEKELGIKPQSDDPTGKTAVDLGSNLAQKPATLYADYMDIMKNNKSLMLKINKGGATGAFGGLLAVGTMAYSGIGFDANTASSMCNAVGSLPDCKNVINNLGKLAGKGNLINAGSNAVKAAKFMKCLGPIGNAFSAYSTAVGAVDDYNNEDYVGATFKGIGTIASTGAAIAGTYAICVASSGPAAPVVALVGGVIALGAWGLDAWLGESDQETIIRQADCEKKKPEVPMTDYEQQQFDRISSPYYTHPGKI